MIMIIQTAIEKALDGHGIPFQEMEEIMNDIIEGHATAAQIGAFLAALRAKGETEEEIAAGASIMREKSIYVKSQGYTIDTCGTGGDGKGTFNISTAVAIVAAACGLKVVKHGNRSISSKSGSADVLEALGVHIRLSPDAASKCLESTNISFMFAPDFHPAMKSVAPIRKELGTRTLFNILGPLSNPARVKGQVLGVYHVSLTEKLAYALGRLGLEKAMVVHGLDGLDEITTTTQTKVSELKDGAVTTYYISPEQFGLKRALPEDLLGGDAIENASIIQGLLQGEKGPKRDIVLLNAAAALYVGKTVNSLHEGLQAAAHAIDTGHAQVKLESFIQVSRGLTS